MRVAVCRSMPLAVLVAQIGGETGLEVRHAIPEQRVVPEVSGLIDAALHRFTRGFVDAPTPRREPSR
jgi:hypothetical protein